MVIVRPFKGLRPPKEIVKKLASRPYDVMNSEEARKEAEGNEYSLLHVTKAEIDLPSWTDDNPGGYIRTGTCAERNNGCSTIRWNGIIVTRCQDREGKQQSETCAFTSWKAGYEISYSKNEWRWKYCFSDAQCGWNFRPYDQQ